MPLSEPTSRREHLHTRTIEIKGYRRADGCYDIEGCLKDIKSEDMTLSAGVRRAGEDIHFMWLRITVDMQLTIIDAEAVSDAMPYPGHCDQITPDYKKLIGLSIRPGFTLRVRDLLGGTRGCTHITELVGSLATTAYQTMATEFKLPEGMRPFQLDKCHALVTTGEAVRQYYPKWFKPTETA